MIYRVAILCYVGLLAAGCVDPLGSFSQGVKGSGKLKSESRQVGNFTAIDISGATTAYVTVGPRPSLKIEIDDNLLSHVVTEVRGSMLRIKMKGSVNTSKGLKVWITVPRLEAADVSGASNAEIKGVDAESFTGDFSGASKVKISGAVEEVRLDASGACHVDLRELKSKRASCDVSGASEVIVNASEELSGDLSGASSVRYLGSPRVNVDRSGASSVSKAN